MVQSQPSICLKDSKFRVKANFLLADWLGLRTMIMHKKCLFQAKICCSIELIAEAGPGLVEKTSKSKGGNDAV
jgi:hypothetical protein